MLEIARLRTLREANDALIVAALTAVDAERHALASAMMNMIVPDASSIYLAAMGARDAATESLNAAADAYRLARGFNMTDDIPAIQRRHECDQYEMENGTQLVAWRDLFTAHADRGALLAALARERAEMVLVETARDLWMTNALAWREERDTLRAQVQALQGRVVLVGEGDVYRPPTPDEWQMLFDKRSLQVELTTLRKQLAEATSVQECETHPDYALTYCHACITEMRAQLEGAQAGLEMLGKALGPLGSCNAHVYYLTGCNDCFQRASVTVRLRELLDKYQPPPPGTGKKG